jgi:hypothetical protein
MCCGVSYFKQVYATCFDLYLGHHQANSIKHKLSYLNLVATLSKFLVVIIAEYTLKNVNNI